MPESTGAATGPLAGADTPAAGGGVALGKVAGTVGGSDSSVCSQRCLGGIQEGACNSRSGGEVAMVLAGPGAGLKAGDKGFAPSAKGAAEDAASVAACTGKTASPP